MTIGTEVVVMSQFSIPLIFCTTTSLVHWYQEFTKTAGNKAERLFSLSNSTTNKKKFNALKIELPRAHFNRNLTNNNDDDDND